MSNQRNADKDRELMNEVKRIYDLYSDHDSSLEKSDEATVVEIHLHWLERAVSAEQRNKELEDTLRSIMKQLDSSAAWTDGARAYHLAYKAINGLESEDRGE
jgi:hypothetical protein